MFVDTHCHIDENNAYEYILNAKKANVSILFNASEDLNTSLNNINIAEKFENVYACIGVHPGNVNDFDFSSLYKFKELIKNDNVKALGEIGLDYHYTKDNRETQIKVFRSFLSLAEEFNLPVVIHSRDATKDTIEILKEYNVKGIIHCFSGSLETAKEYIKMGFLLGIGGVLTFKNSRLFEVVKEIPISYIVLETDAPFLTPEPYRKYKNESKYIPVIASSLAGFTGYSLEEIRDITTYNAKRLFDI